MGTSGHVLEKKGQHLLREKRVHFFHFQGRKWFIFSFSNGKFHVTLILMYETANIQAGLGIFLPTMRINLLDFIVNFVFYR